MTLAIQCSNLEQISYVSTVKAEFKQVGFKQKAGFKQLFLATVILLGKNAGFRQLLKKAGIGFKQQKFLYIDDALNEFSVLFVLEFVFQFLYLFFIKKNWGGL